MSRRIRILIVDDEPLGRSLIRGLADADDDVEIVGECATAAAAAREIVRLRPDLVFLDVRMPGGSGFECLAGVPEDALPYVIFVTAYDQYAPKAFEIDAVDYLLKPFSKTRFRESLRRAKRAILQGQLAELSNRMASLTAAHSALKVGPGGAVGEPRSLVVREGATRRAVGLGEIVWIEARDQYSRIHATSGDHLVARSLVSLERELDGKGFYRIHRSTLVNAAFVERAHSERNGAASVVLTTGDRLAVSRRCRRLLAALLQRAARARRPATR